MNEYHQRGWSKNNRTNNKILIDALDKKSKNPAGFLSDIEEFSNKTKITTNQLRNLYDIVVEIKPENMDESRQKLAKLRIMLEYAWNRKTTTHIKPNFYFPLKELINNLMNATNKERLADFKETMEAIVAYSKNRVDR